MADPTYPLFSVFAFCGFLLGLIPMLWHLQAWNAGTCIYMLWAGLASLIQFTNSLIWKGSTANVAPAWCDITTKFMIGASVGIPAASLCINRRLYHIASVRRVSITWNDRRKAILVDIAIAIGVPILVMVLHYVVQGHRFNIIEDVGCIPTTFNTPLAYLFVFMWPLFLGCISFVYAFLTLRAFWIRRVQFQQLLSDNSSLTVGRYFRLMLLSSLEMCCTTPVSTYSIYINTDGVRLARWVSWADTHYNFGYVEMVPRVVWTSNPAYKISVEMGRWIYPLAALLFFGLFGFADEARKNYRAGFQWIRARLGCCVTTSEHVMRLRSRGYFKNQALASGTTLPPISHSSRELKRSDSLFSSVFSYNDGDLEKSTYFIASPSAPVFTSTSETMIGCSEPGSPTSTSHLNPSPSSSPSPPPIAYHPSPSPPFRRPFSSSTILPLTTTYPSSAGPTLKPPNTLPIVIHRESCQTF